MSKDSIMCLCSLFMSSFETEFLIELEVWAGEKAKVEVAKG